jgi:hypothetical protein
MPTALQIGRIGLDIDVDTPMRWDESGDRVTMSGLVHLPSSTAEAKWLSEQLVNLAGRFRSERQVPLISTAWPERNGWVEVQSSEVTPVEGFAPGVNAIRWSASMRRLPGRAMPRYELRRLGYPIANDHSTTRASYAGWLSAPLTATALDLGADVTWTPGERVSDTGAVSFVTGGAAVLYDTVASMFVPIADVYDGAAKIEVDITGSGDWRAVVGKDVQLFAANRVRLNNGLVRVGWNTTDHRLTMQVYTGSAWEALQDQFTFTSGGASLTPLGVSPSAVTVVRNDAARVTIQMLMPFLTSGHRVALFLSLRRGDYNVLGSLKSSSSRQFGINPSTAPATTSLTSAVHRTANDSAGNGWVISSPRAFTPDLTDGWLHLTAGSKSFPFGIGVELDGTTAAGNYTAALVRSQYYAQPGEQIYVTLP